MKAKEIGKISEAELEIMKLLWQEGELASGDIVKRLQNERQWDRSTTRTLLSRLVDKGAVLAEKQQAQGSVKERFVYRADIAEDAYVKTQTKGFIDRLYGGSARDLVAALVDERALSQADLAELRAFFDEAVTEGDEG